MGNCHLLRVSAAAPRVHLFEVSQYSTCHVGYEARVDTAQALPEGLLQRLLITCKTAHKSEEAAIETLAFHAAIRKKAAHNVHITSPNIAMQTAHVIPGWNPETNISLQKRQVLSDLMKYKHCTRTSTADQVYSDIDTNNSLNPYFRYLEQVRSRTRKRYWDRLGDMDDFVDLFIKTSRHFARASGGHDQIRPFSDGILPEINQRVDPHHQFNSEECFRENEQVLVGNISLRKLLSLPEDLLPAPGSPEPADTEISRQDLNAYTLTQAGQICLQWTTNITQHLTLKHSGEATSLMVFAMPCVLSHPRSQIPLSTVGIPGELQEEIILSYALLFGRYSERQVSCRFFGPKICRCYGCKLVRVFEKVPPLKDVELDPLLQVHSREVPGSKIWEQRKFKHFWSRIQRVNEFSRRQKPTTLAQLFIDKRETLQYYTFCFAAFLLFLTVVQWPLLILLPFEFVGMIKLLKEITGDTMDVLI
ncbi:hypothetical protein BDD12DRAFT_945551 [Trichophaea hybrida]|nr:hypothetical protein BDD12DRAFT_945551 [Trichophaea hybrida]